MSYWVECFGVRVCSDLDLFGSRALPGSHDVVIRLRCSRREITPALAVQWGREPHQSFSWALIPGLARVEAHDNGEVIINTKEGVDEHSLRTLSATTALPLAFQALPGLLLEASAIRWRGQALLILGRGYCGKSTLAALMADLGAELLADSHCFVRLDDKGELSVAPALPHVRLWPEQARLLGPGWPAPKVLRPGLQKQLYLVPDRFASSPTGIKGVVLLRRGVDEQFRQDRLDLAECLKALAVASDRLRTIGNPVQTALRFKIMSRLASLPVCHLMQWPRYGRHELETRSRLLDLLSAHAWEAAV